jgi:hypothetical protein
MTVQTINIGNQVNDGLGDDLRSAFQKVNANFTELSQQLTVTATNVGATGAGVFKEKVGADLRFRKIVNGTKITVEELDSSIRISNPSPDSFTRIEADSNFIVADQFGHVGIGGSENIRTTANPSTKTITIDTRLNFSKILTDYDFGPISFDYSNPSNVFFNIQFLLNSANIDFGTFTNPSEIDLDLGEIS